MWGGGCGGGGFGMEGEDLIFEEVLVFEGVLFFFGVGLGGE